VSFLNGFRLLVKGCTGACVIHNPQQIIKRFAIVDLLFGLMRRFRQRLDFCGVIVIAQRSGKLLRRRRLDLGDIGAGLDLGLVIRFIGLLDPAGCNVGGKFSRKSSMSGKPALKSVPSGYSAISSWRSFVRL
jgi:hypothetical protein